MMPQSTPLVPYRTQSGGYSWTDIWGRFQRERVIFISDFIDEQAANKIIATLLFFAEGPDRSKKVTLYFNSPGALQQPGWAVFDAMMNVPYNITTVNFGLATGMGAFLCAAGHTRTALPNSRFLIQYTGLEEVYRGQASDIKLMVANNKRLNNRMVLELMRITGQKEDRIREDLKRDFYLSSDEAVRYGIIDGVTVAKAKRPLAIRKNEVWKPTGFGAFEGEIQTYQDKVKQVGRQEYIVDREEEPAGKPKAAPPAPRAPSPPSRPVDDEGPGPDAGAGMM